MVNNVRLATVSLGLALALGAAQAYPGMEKGGHPACPMKVKGAQVQVQKTETGVVIRVTGKDKATIGRIQAAAGDLARHHGTQGCPDGEENCGGPVRYGCPMKDYVGPMTSDGRCPKCGMNLEKL